MNGLINVLLSSSPPSPSETEVHFFSAFRPQLENAICLANTIRVGSLCLFTYRLKKRRGSVAGGGGGKVEKGKRPENKAGRLDVQEKKRAYFF